MKTLFDFVRSLFPKRAGHGVTLVAVSGAVVLSYSEGAVTFTPELARRLAVELPALATIAEYLKAGDV